MRVVQTLLDPNMSLMLGKEPFELYIYYNIVRKKVTNKFIKL